LNFDQLSSLLFSFIVPLQTTSSVAL